QDPLGKVIGLVVLPNKTPSETMTLAGTVTLNFVFGLDSNGQFVIRDPELRANVKLSHPDSFNLAVRLGALGMGIENGLLNYDATVAWNVNGTVEFAPDGIVNEVIGPFLSSTSHYQVQLPLVLRGAVDGIVSTTGMVIGTFNLDQNPARIPAGAKLK